MRTEFPNFGLFCVVYWLRPKRQVCHSFGRVLSCDCACACVCVCVWSRILNKQSL